MAESMCPPEDGKKDWSFLDDGMTDREMFLSIIDAHRAHLHTRIQRYLEYLQVVEKDQRLLKSWWMRLIDYLNSHKLKAAIDAREKEVREILRTCMDRKAFYDMSNRAGDEDYLRTIVCQIARDQGI